MLLRLVLVAFSYFCVFFFSSRRRHTRLQGDWSSDVCSSDLGVVEKAVARLVRPHALRQLVRLTVAEPIADLPAYVRRVPVQIGRASCRERVYSAVGAGCIK